MASSSPLFPSTPLFALFVEDANAAHADALARLITPLLASLGVVASSSSSSSSSSSPFFSAAEEAVLAVVLGFAANAACSTLGAFSPAARVRRLVEGSLYTLETAAHANSKTAVFGAALLGAGMTEAAAVAFGNVWTAGSGAAVLRLRAKPFAPLVLAGSAVRVALQVGGSGDAMGGRESRATFDLALSSNANANANADGDEVLSLELSMTEVGALLERLDAIQAQVDSLA